MGLNALFSIADTILVNSGYKKPAVGEMKQKIKDVFGAYPYEHEQDPLISFIFGCNEPLIDEDGNVHDIINDYVVDYYLRNPIYISYKHQLITYAYYKQYHGKNN
ncbi:MAG: hypothetical protein LBJ63_08340 [Prevotellaceae bacterium]|jgi:hypothetical protein|nr:hypothetical protein [Prevotellaceae bacterium]